MGGLVALQLVEAFGLHAESIILIETNLRPAEPFYRNLLLPQNIEKCEDTVMAMLKKEAPYYSDALKQTWQNDFDFTMHVKKSRIPVHALYGDRGQADYGKKIDDLNLDEETRSKLEFYFVRNACHLLMVENPYDTADCIKAILAAFSLFDGFVRVAAGRAE